MTKTYQNGPGRNRDASTAVHGIGLCRCLIPRSGWRFAETDQNHEALREYRHFMGDRQTDEGTTERHRHDRMTARKRSLSYWAWDKKNKQDRERRSTSRVAGKLQDASRSSYAMGDNSLSAILQSATACRTGAGRLRAESRRLSTWLV